MVLRRLDSITVSRLQDDLHKLGPDLTINYIRQLALNYDCSEVTIYYYMACIRGRNLPMPATGGPRRVITWPMEQAIKILLDQRPWYYQDEIAQFLHDAFDIEVH